MQKYKINIKKEELELFIEKKFKLYEAIFNKYMLGGSIYGKDYETTLIRSLICYFLYEEKSNGYKVTYEVIAKLFGIDKSTVRKSVSRIKLYVNIPQVVESDKIKLRNVFHRFYYLFQKEFAKSEKLKK